MVTMAKLAGGKIEETARKKKRGERRPRQSTNEGNTILFFPLFIFG